MYFGWLPLSKGLIALLFILVTVGTTLHLSVSVPWLGIHFSAQPDPLPGMIIKSVAHDSPAHNKLFPGQRVERILSKGGTIAPEPLLLQTPSSLASFDDTETFYLQQETAFNTIREKSLLLTLADQEKIVIYPAQKRPLTSFPLFYWALLMAGIVGLAISIYACCNKPDNFPAKLLLVSGTLYYLSNLTTAVMQHELALSASFFRTTAMLENFFLNAFLGLFLIILMFFPARIVSNQVIVLLIGIISLMSLNEVFHWIPLPYFYHAIKYLALGLFALFLLNLQWQQAQDKPEKSAAVMITFLPLWVGSVILLLLSMGSHFFAWPELVTMETVRLCYPFALLGLAIAISNYHLYDEETWWSLSTMIMLLAITIFFLSLLLTKFFSYHPFVALIIALFSGGGLLFVLRKHLIKRLHLSSMHVSEADFLDEVVTLSTILDENDLENSWRNILETRFNPGEITRENGPTETRFSDTGLDLFVADVTNGGHYRLSGKAKRQRLFNQHDVTTAETLLSIVRMLSDTKRIHDDALSEERSRIYRDIHDTIGASLLTLMYQASTEEDAENTKIVLQTLRDTVRISSRNSPVSLQETLADNHAEARERVEIAGAELKWTENNIPTDIRISLKQSIAIFNVFREAISNALRHAQPTTIWVDIEVNDRFVEIRLANDGVTNHPSEWKQGFGIQNMQSRIESLGGTFEIHPNESNNIISLAIKLPC